MIGLVWIYHNGVMVSEIAPNVVDGGFDHQSGQTKDYEIGIGCFSTKHATLMSKNNGATCLSAELFQWANAKQNPAKHVGLIQSGPHLHLI